MPSRRQLMVMRGCLVVLVVSGAVWIPFVAGFTDLHVYRTAGWAWFGGPGLYSAAFREAVAGLPLPFLYPPFAALVFTPLALVPWHVSKVLITGASLAALAVTVLVAARREEAPLRAAVLAFAIAAGWAVFEPVRQTVNFGQINLILMGLVAVDCLAERVRWPRGLLLGIAAAIKLTPAVFALFFLLRRQYRPVLVSFAAFVGCGLLGVAIAPADSLRYWFEVLLAPGDSVGIAYAYNQSILAVLTRLTIPTPARFAAWVVLVLATLAIALIGAYRARSRGDEVTALLLIAVWGLLASPISWSHHWVWILPATVVLYRLLRHGRPAPTVVSTLILAVFIAGAHAYLPQTGGAELQWTWWQHLLGSSYVITGLAVLIILAIRPLTPPPGTPQHPAHHNLAPT